MKIFAIIIFYFISLVSLPSYALNIAIVNINYLIDNNKTYLNIIEDIVLNQDQLNSKIINYNNELDKFTNLIEEYNFHYSNEIIKIRESILSNIIKILEKYADENKLDLILDSNSYLIGSNSLDITDIINKKLEDINFKLEYKNFEKD